jgi:hypothetical protein
VGCLLVDHPPLCDLEELLRRVRRSRVRVGGGAHSVCVGRRPRQAEGGEVALPDVAQEATGQRRQRLARRHFLREQVVEHVIDAGGRQEVGSHQGDALVVDAQVYQTGQVVRVEGDARCTRHTVVEVANVLGAILVAHDAVRHVRSGDPRGEGGEHGRCQLWFVRREVAPASDRLAEPVGLIGGEETPPVRGRQQSHGRVGRAGVAEDDREVGVVDPAQVREKRTVAQRIGKCPHDVRVAQQTHAAGQEAVKRRASVRVCAPEWAAGTHYATVGECGVLEVPETELQAQVRERNTQIELLATRGVVAGCEKRQP